VDVVASVALISNADTPALLERTHSPYASSKREPGTAGLAWNPDIDTVSPTETPAGVVPVKVAVTEFEKVRPAVTAVQA
jgi:hypothetical protein